MSSGQGGCIFRFPGDNLFLMPTGGSETGMTGLCSHFIDQILNRVGSLFKVIKQRLKKVIAKSAFFLNALLPHIEE